MKEIIVVVALLAIFLIIAYIIRLFTCNICPYKDECKKRLEKGEIPPCTKSAMQNPFNNQMPNGI